MEIISLLGQTNFIKIVFHKNRLVKRSVETRPRALIKLRLISRNIEYTLIINNSVAERQTYPPSQEEREELQRRKSKLQQREKSRTEEGGAMKERKRNKLF